MIRRFQIQSDNISRLLGELWIGGQTPTTTSGQTDSQRAQLSPHLVDTHITQCRRQQRASPGAKAGRRGLVQCGQQTLACGLIVDGGFPRSEIIGQASQTLLIETRAPLADTGLTSIESLCDLGIGEPFGSPQYNPRSFGVARLSLW